MSKEQKQEQFAAMLDRSTVDLVQQCEKGADLLGPVAGFSSPEEKALIRRLCVVAVVKTFFGYYEKLSLQLEAYFRSNPEAELLATVRETLRIDADYQVQRANRGLRVPARWDQILRESLESVMRELLGAQARAESLDALDPKLFTVFGHSFLTAP